MISLNQILYGLDLKLIDIEGQFPTEEPFYAFSSAQNIVRALAPFDNSWVPYAIFQAADNSNRTSQPTERLMMTHVGTQVVNQTTYHVYESLVPPAVLSNSRAKKITFTLALVSTQEANYNNITYTFKGLIYLDQISQNMTQTLNNLIVGQENYDFVRVVVDDENTDYYYLNGNWVENNFLFQVEYIENRSEKISFALYEGDLTGMPTVAPDNTALIITSLNSKVDQTTLEQNYFSKEESDARYSGFIDDVNVMSELPQDLSVYNGKYILIRNTQTNQITDSYYIQNNTALSVRFIAQTDLIVSEEQPVGQQIGDLWYDIE